MTIFEDEESTDVDEEHQEFITLMKSCTACNLAKDRTQVVVGDYGPKGGICFVGEAPGAQEDSKGRPFVGRSGKLLDEMLQKIGIGRDGVSVLNIAKCRPPQNRNPTKNEAITCTELWLTKQLEFLKPAFLVTLGGVALSHFAPGRKPTRARGELIDTGMYKIYPMLHPAYVLYGGITREEYLEDFEDMMNIYQKVSQGDWDTVKSKTVEKQTGNRENSNQGSLDEFF